MTKRLLTTQKIVNLSADPGSGVSGEVYFNTTSNVLKTYNGTSWVNVGGGGGATVSTTPPSSPISGSLWFDSDTAKTYVYYESAWVEIGASSLPDQTGNSEKYLTTNGTSASWVTVNYQPLDADLTSIAALNPTITGNLSFFQGNTNNLTWSTQVSYLSNNLTAVTYANNTFLTVASGGGIGQTRLSTNGISWITGTSLGINGAAIAYNDIWLVAGQIGAVSTSTDAINWTSRNSLMGVNNIYAAAYGNGNWVIAGSAGQIRTSTDTVTWVTRTSNLINVESFYALEYANDLWLAGTKRFYELRASTDAITWVTRMTNLQHVTNAIHYANGVWVIGGGSGQIRTSTDAISWATATSNFGTQYVKAIGYGDGIWTATGYAGIIRTSTDALTWVTRDSTFGTSRVDGVAYGNNTWAAVGESGQIRSSVYIPSKWQIDSSLYATLASPTFTGIPLAPTAAADTNTTQLATTGYVVGQGYLKSATASSTYAPISSPTFIGIPLVPTATAGTNTTQIATTAFVQTAVNTTTINTQTASYSLVLGDAGEIIEMNVASANTVTVPLNSSQAFPIGTSIDIVQYGAGQTTVVATGGVTIRASGNKLKLTGQYSAATLYKRGTDEWVIMGDLSA